MEIRIMIAALYGLSRSRETSCSLIVLNAQHGNVITSDVGFHFFQVDFNSIDLLIFLLMFRLLVRRTTLLTVQMNDSALILIPSQLSFIIQNEYVT